MDSIPFNRPHRAKNQMRYIQEAINSSHWSGDGHFTRMCVRLLGDIIPAPQILLTHSCTAALEMAAMLLEIRPGDEVIMPSYTFVSTANAFVLRGAVPVFVDIRADTNNLDEKLIEQAITTKTKAIVPVHYAGVACAMEEIVELAAHYQLAIVEDAAQSLFSRYRGRPLGSFGTFSALSFHETKNVISGEGGALIVNDQSFCERAEILREKGTNRSRYFRGQVDKYTWMDIGSSFLPSDILAALLAAQLEDAQEIQAYRHEIWQKYHDAFADLEAKGWCRRPSIPAGCEHNAHMYYLHLPSLAIRTALLAELRTHGIGAVFHYIPLHSSPMGRKVGRVSNALLNTDRAGDCLMRLPYFIGVAPEIDRLVDLVYKHFSNQKYSRHEFLS